jgi:hypothetical protein
MIRNIQVWESFDLHTRENEGGYITADHTCPCGNTVEFWIDLPQLQGKTVCKECGRELTLRLSFTVGTE